VTRRSEVGAAERVAEDLEQAVDGVLAGRYG
jgi:hypothetical protein